MQGIVNHCPSNEWTNRFGNFETVFNYTSRNNRITFGNGDKSCNKSTIEGLRFFFFFFLIKLKDRWKTIETMDKIYLSFRLGNLHPPLSSVRDG